MAAPVLIYCADGNRRLADIAVRQGFLYGSRSGVTYYHPPAFLDLDHRRPDFGRHAEEAARLRPRYAVAGDAETPAQLDIVIRQAEQLAPHAQRVIVVPKVSGLVEPIPSQYVVGLSVPTRFGGTSALYFEYLGRSLHLLGGSPQRQMRLWQVFGTAVESVDGNSHQRAATRWNTVWQDGGWVSKERARALNDECGTGPDAPYRAFERSCANILAAWRRLTGGTV